MEEKIKIKTVARYGGHQVKANKSVDIAFKFDYSELSKYIQLIQMLNENIAIKIKQLDKPSEMIGIFMVKSINIDHDGESTIKFNSMTDQSEVQLFHGLAGDEPFKIMFEADIARETEDDDHA